MKKLILLILLFIVGCATLKESTTYTTAAKFKIGMTEKEFITQNPSITKSNDWQQWVKVINSPKSITYIEHENKTTFVFHKADEEEKTTHGLTIPNPHQKYIFAFNHDTLFAVYHELNDNSKIEIDYSKYPNSKPE